MFQETPDTQMHSITPAWYNSLFVTVYVTKVCWTWKILLRYIVFQPYYHIEIIFGRRNSDGFCVTGGVKRHIDNFDDISLEKVVHGLILVGIRFYLISVTKLWDMIIHLCMCKWWIGHANVQDSESSWLTTNEYDIILQITIQSENLN